MPIYDYSRRIACNSPFLTNTIAGDLEGCRESFAWPVLHLLWVSQVATKLSLQDPTWKMPPLCLLNNFAKRQQARKNSSGLAAIQNFIISKLSKATFVFQLSSRCLISKEQSTGSMNQDLLEDMPASTEILSHHGQAGCKSARMARKRKSGLITWQTMLPRQTEQRPAF